MNWMFDGIGTDEKLGDFGLVGDGAAGLELDIYEPALGTPPETLIAAASENHTDIYLEVLEELYFNVPGTGGSQDARVRADISRPPTRNRLVDQLHRVLRLAVWSMASSLCS